MTVNLFNGDPYTVRCCYNAIQFITILHTAPWWQQQKVNQISNSQQTPHNSPLRASYGVSIMRILKKIDRIITTPHCTWKDGLYKETGSRSIITWHCIHLHLFVTTGQLKLVLCIAGDHWLPHVKILAWFTLFLIRHVYAKNAHNYKNPEMKYGNWISLTLHIYPQGCCVIGIYCDHSRDKH